MRITLINSAWESKSRCSDQSRYFSIVAQVSVCQLLTTCKVVLRSPFCEPIGEETCGQILPSYILVCQVYWPILRYYYRKINNTLSTLIFDDVVKYEIQGFLATDKSVDLLCTSAYCDLSRSPPTSIRLGGRYKCLVAAIIKSLI